MRLETYLWLIPFLPLLASVVNGVLGWGPVRRVSHHLAVGSVGVSFLLAILVFFHVQFGPTSTDVRYFTWIPSGELQVPVGFLIDPLTSIMMLVITGVGFLIHVYSIGYMHGDDGFARFFSYLNLFMFSMLILVMADNYLLLFVGWEGVGLCSYLLIAFWHERVSAIQAGTKAFVVNRIGDAAFLVAIFLIWGEFGSLDYGTVFGNAHRLPESIATAITLCLFIGAIGKSAQIPLYTWLPDAMEGPTPVSALIHAATMVTAGVYMVARNHELYALAPFSMATVAWIGGITALFAATIGLVQYDIKRVLAYSTVSQLGYMFLACGLGAYAVGIFHLVTHAFFKALLFLSAGSVIHALGGEQDMRKMGGLRSQIPRTAVLFYIGALAIAGIPPLAGFWSKDEILVAAFAGGRSVLFGLTLFAAFLTAFYMFRQVYLVFYGESRVDPHAAAHVHESPWVMVGPLVALGALSLVGGLIPGFPPEHGWIHSFLAPAVGAGHEAAPGSAGRLVTAAAMAAGFSGWGLARWIYRARPLMAEQLAERLHGAHTVLRNKYWVDEIYDALVVEPAKALGRRLHRFDDRVIDGAVNAVGRMVDTGGGASTWFEKHVIYGVVNVTGYANHIGAKYFRRLQTGLVHHYAAIMVLGLLLLIHLYLVSRGQPTLLDLLMAKGS